MRIESCTLGTRKLNNDSRIRTRTRVHLKMLTSMTGVSELHRISTLIQTININISGRRLSNSHLNFLRPLQKACKWRVAVLRVLLKHALGITVRPRNYAWD